MDTTLRALNGFGLGARAGERRRVSDPREWLRAQLKGGSPVLPPPAGAAPADIAAALAAFRSAAQQRPDANRDARQEARRRLVAIAAAESRAALSARVVSERPFVERLVAFWSNHLCVSAGAKILVAPLAGSYEREAIRPHVLGRFADMVLASAKHPAMLVYLDNFQSIGPNSRGAQAARSGQRRGLNENYARELLELHTLGVNGGYTQQDVQELAKMLTGWTVSGLGRGPQRGLQRGRRQIAMPDDDRVGFAFQELLHEPGSKTLLGVRYGEGGVTEAERAINGLCRHASTARFVATKLVTHFVGDAPPAHAVDRIAKVFRDGDGNLGAVSAALIDLPEAWSDGARKFRTPQDWLVAILRAFNAGEAPDMLVTVLRQLRHPLWSPQAPKGFDDTTAGWADPDALLNRAELARTITRRLRAQGAVDARALLDVVDIPAGDQLPKFIADSSIAMEERVALLLAGPAFQWR
ncbi:MAG TPA: DUF1800 domain-containing protein [Vicinamibacterales bacterium]|nr:DUF1800 domain-containing protein [Vicinamibacterales bacterium]